jgi:hypothetical protein
MAEMENAESEVESLEVDESAASEEEGATEDVSELEAEVNEAEQEVEALEFSANQEDGADMRLAQQQGSTSRLLLLPPCAPAPLRPCAALAVVERRR